MTFSIPLILFVILLSFSTQVISHMHIGLPAKLLDYFLRSNKSNINQSRIFVLCTKPTAASTKMRSHAAPVHDAPDPAASLQSRQQVDVSNVLGDANAPQGQTRARTHHFPQLATAASPASTIQIYAAPSLLTRIDYWGWTLSMHVPADAELKLLSDIKLGRALVHHQYMLEMPAGYFQHPNTDDATQAVTVVAMATLQIKVFVYLLADIIGPATLLKDNLAELHVPIRSGNTPRTKHTYTVHNHLNAVFAHPQTLADIGISKQAHLTHLVALHAAW